jgi:hypothetical protein
MNGGRCLRLGLACILVLGGTAGTQAAAAGASAPEEATVEVSVSRSHVSTRLGGTFGFSSTITNVGPRAVSGLVAHLNVVGLSEGIYVDPEDWSEQRTQTLAPLHPGQSVEVPWSVKAVTGGRAAIYVVVLSGRAAATSSESLAVSPAMDVRITERRTLNTGGVLPIALGVPALLGLATLTLRIRRRS